MLHKSLNLSAVEAFAEGLAKETSPPAVICLWGDLGAGKTTFSRAFIRALTTPETIVPSPTFTLVQTYEIPMGHLSHFDLYRMTSVDEIYEINLPEAIHQHICLIEWPERLEGQLPHSRIDIHLTINDDETRDVEINYLS